MKKKFQIWTLGLAMFSMFFGAGNIVFPLILGMESQSQFGWAMLGLFVTAVLIPFAGLASMVLFKGSYIDFFGRIGLWPGRILIASILAVIGPFGGLPRCISLSYSTFTLLYPDCNSHIFQIVACSVIFFFAFRKSKIISWLGNVLTPLLLVVLAFIVVKGIWLVQGSTNASDLSTPQAFGLGFKLGYNTLDLLAAFFFSSVIINILQHGEFFEEPHGARKALLKTCIKASVIGMILLTLVYVGFGIVASMHHQALQGVHQDMLLGSLSMHILGSSAGYITLLCVILACLTTAISLAAIFAEYLQIEICKKRISYSFCLFFTLLASYVVASLGFTTIVKLLAPLLEVAYPSLIALALLNIGYKMGWVKTIKVPFYLLLFYMLFVTIM